VGSPFRPITAGDRQILGELINDVYRQFTEVVARERNLAPAAVQQVSDGRILSGRQALERGLIDRLGNFNDALSAAGRMAGLGDDPRIARPPKEDVTLLDVLLGGGISGVVNRLVRPLETAGMPRVKYLIPW
jgi:protease-4